MKSYKKSLQKSIDILKNMVYNAFSNKEKKRIKGDYNMKNKVFLRKLTSKKNGRPYVGIVFDLGYAERIIFINQYLAAELMETTVNDLMTRNDDDYNIKVLEEKAK